MRAKASIIKVVSESGESAPKTLEFSGSKEELRGFLYKLLPKSGYKCALTKRNRTGKDSVHNHFFKARKGVIRFSVGRISKNEQVYIAQASFQEKGTEFSGRTQANAAFIKNFFMDIDCGAGKPYATQADGKAALLSFCQRTGLPVPAIVNSGNGLYAHWIFSREVAVADWTLVANKLQKLVRALEPGLDADNLIPDSARVLRPVGAIHRKDPSNPKTVTLVQDYKPLKFETLAAIIDKALAALPAAPVPTKQSPVKCNATSEQHSTSSAIRIADKCSVIGHFRDTEGNVTEPLWFASIVLLRHCAESPGIIHDWSSGHPDYSREKTDAKIAQCSTPPTTCEHFSGLCPDLCSTCEHHGKINSPIVLGFTSPSVEFPDYVRELNSDNFVSRIGGRTVVFREVYDQVLNRYKLEPSTFSDFKNYHSNQRIPFGLPNQNGQQATIPLGKAWLESPDRRQFSEVRLTPEGDIDGVYNLWRGFMVKPAEGSWTLMRKHIRNVICDSDKTLFRYLLGWLARLIQKPWVPGEVAIVLRGKKGIGKGIFVNQLCTIFGQHAMAIYNGKHLTGNFNAHLQDCILLFVDEGFWAGDKGGESVLKGLITEPTIPIERKGFDLQSVRNLLHIVIASNNDWVIPASMDERRYCVLNVSDRYIGDLNYFKALATEADNGGLGALLYYLQNKDISDFDVRDIPKTQGLTDQKLQSLDAVMTWWYQKLCDGVLLDGYAWNEAVPSDTLYKSYVNAAQQQGVHRRSGETAFGLALRKALPKGWPKKSRQKAVHEPERIKSERVSHYEFPSLTICRKRFSEVLGDDGLEWE